MRKFSPRIETRLDIIRRFVDRPDPNIKMCPSCRSRKVQAVTVGLSEYDDKYKCRRCGLSFKHYD